MKVKNKVRRESYCNDCSVKKSLQYIHITICVFFLYMIIPMIKVQIRKIKEMKIKIANHWLDLTMAFK